MTAVRMDHAAPPPSYVVVIPTLGRPCLQDCLNALAEAHGPLPHQVVLADDRPTLPICCRFASRMSSRTAR